MTTFQSLLAAAGKLPPLEEKESDDDYLKRLILVISGIPIPAFERMPDDARLWFDTATDALSAGMRVAPPEGFDREAALRPAPAAPQSIKRPNGVSYTPPAFKAPPRPPAPPGGPVAGEPIRDTLIKLMIKEPDLTAEGLKNRLAQHHIKTSFETIATQRAFAVSMLRLIREAGWQPP
jgi:hypothetical protein